MSIIGSLPDKVKTRTPCGVLISSSGIMGRYAKLPRKVVYECLICGREDFSSGQGLLDHCKKTHIKREDEGEQ